LLEKRRRMLSEKRSFIRAGTIGFGVPSALWELWVFREYRGGIWFSLFVVVTTVAGAWLWAFLMWQVYKATVLEKQGRTPAQGTKAQGDQRDAS